MSSRSVSSFLTQIFMSELGGKIHLICNTICFAICGLVEFHFTKLKLLWHYLSRFFFQKNDGDTVIFFLKSLVVTILKIQFCFNFLAYFHRCSLRNKFSKEKNIYQSNKSRLQLADTIALEFDKISKRNSIIAVI